MKYPHYGPPVTSIGFWILMQNYSQLSIVCPLHVAWALHNKVTGCQEEKEKASSSLMGSRV